MKKIKLQVLNNCFRDKSKKHLGVKYNGEWFAITHSPKDEGILIPASCINNKKPSLKPQYLKKLTNTAPNVLNPISVFIDESILLNYDEIQQLTIQK